MHIRHALLLSLPLFSTLPAGRAQAEEPAEARDSIDATQAPASADTGGQLFSNLQRVPDEFTLVNAKRRLSLHRPMYVMPASYSPQYSGHETEFLFQISMKLRLLNRNLFFGYTQKSFWQIYNAQDSRPFRETNYDPEVFYRWQPRLQRCEGCGLDFGLEHESNGKDLPDSRSWNRLTLAGYYQNDNTLLHLKTWYRIPEQDKTSAEDANGDDNPDIARYYGYTELRVQQLLPAGQHLALMLRGNPATGRGAIELNYSLPYGDALYWNLYVFNGYGESLIDYNLKQSRVGLGVTIAGWQ